MTLLLVTFFLAPSDDSWQNPNETRAGPGHENGATACRGMLCQKCPRTCPKKHADAAAVSRSRCACIQRYAMRLLPMHLQTSACSSSGASSRRQSQRTSRKALLRLYAGSNKTLAPAASSRRQSQRTSSTLTTSATATCVLSMKRTTLIRLAN